MSSTVVVPVEGEEMLAELRAEELLKDVPEHALYALMTAGTVTMAYYQMERFGTTPGDLRFMVSQVQELAAKLLLDSGMSEQNVIEAFKISDRVFAGKLRQAYADLEANKLPLDASELARKES